jgi:acyl-coenzyme A thioesterase PaaI-like protein
MTQPGTVPPVPSVLSELPEVRLALADRIRELVDAMVLSDATDAELRDAADRVAAVTASLRERRRDSALMLVQGDEGWFTSVHNPVEGPGSPIAPPLTDFRIENGVLRASTRLTHAHEGAPGRAHGGWVAALLDHAVGRAAALSGSSAMTVSLTVDYRKGTPFNTPLDIEGRYLRKEGRKIYTTAAIRADGEVTAEASAILVAVSGLPRPQAANRDQP